MPSALAASATAPAAPNCLRNDRLVLSLQSIDFLPDSFLAAPLGQPRAEFFVNVFENDEKWRRATIADGGLSKDVEARQRKLWREELARDTQETYHPLGHRCQSSAD